MPDKNLIIIPTYNESENIASLIEQILALPILVDVLIVDDNSPDGTAQIIQAIQQNNPKIKLLKRASKLGLGTAYIEGFKIALQQAYNNIITMDADFSHDPKHLVQLIKNLEIYDLVIGSRYCLHGGIKNWTWDRRIISRGGCLYAQLILNVPIKDLTAGFVAYRANLLKKINLDRISGQGYAFQIEMKYRAWQNNATIKEIPITFIDRRVGKSKMSSNIIKEGLIMPWLLKIRHVKK